MLRGDSNAVNDVITFQGVMPTQYQGFPMAVGESRQWTEYYAAQDLRGDEGTAKLSKLHSPDYHGTAIPSVEDWLNSESIGSSNSGVYDEMDKFLEELADRTPTEDEMMHSADGWGALEEMRIGKMLVPGALFPKDPAPLLANHNTKPWYVPARTTSYSGCPEKQSGSRTRSYACMLMSTCHVCILLVVFSVHGPFSKVRAGDDRHLQQGKSGQPPYIVPDGRWVACTLGKYSCHPRRHLAALLVRVSVL